MQQLPEVTPTLTEEDIVRALPKGLKKRVGQSLVDEINRGLAQELELRENYRDNILGYMDVLTEGKWNMHEYINAVRYVSYKLLGNSNIRAYQKTFPDRFERLTIAGTSQKDMQAYASGFNKTKLVNLIYAQTLIPTYVLNADVHQEAINCQAELMRTAKSEKVRSDAANSLLTHLKQPDAQAVSLGIKPATDSSLEELKEITRQLAVQQKELIDSGTTNAKVVAESKIIKTVPAPE